MLGPATTLYLSARMSIDPCEPPRRPRRRRDRNLADRLRRRRFEDIKKKRFEGRRNSAVTEIWLDGWLRWKDSRTLKRKIRRTKKFDRLRSLVRRTVMTERFEDIEDRFEERRNSVATEILLAERLRWRFEDVEKKDSKYKEIRP